MAGYPYNVWGEAGSTTIRGHGTGWILAILPFIERSELAQSWNYQTNVAGNGPPASMAGNRPIFGPGGPGPGLAGPGTPGQGPTASAAPFPISIAAETDVRGFYCPSRRSSIRPGQDDAMLLVTGWTGGGTDYGGCVGRHNAYAADAAHSVEDAAINKNAGYTPTGSYAVVGDRGRKRWGIFGRVNQSTAFREVRDGLSNTIMTGELQRIISTDAAGTPIPGIIASHDGWAIGGDATGFTTGYVTPTATSGAGARAGAGSEETPVPVPPTPPGSGVWNSSMSNGFLMDNGYFPSPGSDHSNGANFGQGDGSVRFFVSRMDPNIFALLGSMADGVVISWDY